MKMKMQTRSEQRAAAARMEMAAATLELLLYSQVRRALAGDRQALGDFQQDIQMAPPATRIRVLRVLEDARKR